MHQVYPTLYCEKVSPRLTDFLPRTIIILLSLFASFSPEAQVKLSGHSITRIDSIHLPPELAMPENEFSGLQVHKKKLFLLAESRVREKQEALLYSISLNDLKRNKRSRQLAYDKWMIRGLDLLEKRIPEFEGLEAFVIHKRTVYLSIETSAKSPWAYLAKGKFSGNELVLDTSLLVVRKPHKSTGEAIHNAAFEAMLLAGDRLHLFFEYNYFERNFIYSFPADFSGGIDSIPFQKLPFRIADITGRKNSYTAINIFYKGGGPDTVYRVPQSDSVSHRLTFTNEYVNHTRLVTIRQSDGSYNWEHLYSLPEQYQGYNWEGLARWKKGFFLVNDKYTPYRPYHTLLLYLH